MIRQCARHIRFVSDEDKNGKRTYVSDKFADVHELFNDCIGFLRGATFASLIDGCLIVTFVLLLFEELFDGLRVIDIDRSDLPEC